MAVKERRKSRRITVQGAVRAAVPPGSQPVVLVNVSTSGFAIATKDPFAHDGELRCRFESQEVDWSTELSCRPMYFLVQPQSSGPHRGSFVTGFSFADADVPAVRQEIEALLHHAMGVTADMAG